VPYFLSRYDPDPLRYYLRATAPETRDTVFSWEDFVERNNNELVATWDNLANRPRGTRVRMLSFAYKRFDGKVPEPGELDDEDRALLTRAEAGFETVGELYNACRFRAAQGEAMGLAREANGYLDRKAPWSQIKEDPQAAAMSVYVILRVVEQPEDHPGAQPAAHGPTTPRVPGLRGPAVRDADRWASTRTRRVATSPHLRPQRRHRHLGAERAAGRAGTPRAGAALQEAGCGGTSACQLGHCVVG
jgi:hypothetical protein